MSAEAQEFYIGLFKQLFDSEEWQTFCTDDGLACDTWLSGSALGDYHTEQIALHKQLIQSVGAAAITGE
jgi:tripartite-type tricarboxylate transporter receptor subunit TctC